MRRNTKMTILLVGTNALTFVYTAALAGRLLKKDKESFEELMRIARVNRKAVMLFVANAPREVSQKVMDEVAFDWVVRDLTDHNIDTPAPKE